jgi:hypothetical protein
MRSRVHVYACLELRGRGRGVFQFGTGNRTLREELILYFAGGSDSLSSSAM